MEITRRRSMSAMRGARQKKDMWTEVTKDLVIKEAIDELGYDYEETPEFFYVIDYLRYVSSRNTHVCLVTHTHDPPGRRSAARGALRGYSPRETR